ncbi:phage tail tape measure protein [Dysgonomonas mossii]|uniref:Phage tail tape measure protein domain-containing protein n=1 Tax=Dysgonomonas mossii DSM 22836 TaxID=742767 RepID=F8X559_9BACT|nr:phage tail tape measure protein [Dysgonomonas mossii]EGK04665.1 hypothetical protein HMPREF9456_03368 [Dysgonomonas mossii DSM 22836]
MADANSKQEDIILDIDVRYEDAISGIVKYKKAIEDIRRANAEYKKEVQDGTKTEDEYNKAVAANAEITTQYNNKIKALRKEIQNNIKEETNRTGSIKKLEAEIARLVRQYEVLGNTESEIAQKKDLSEKISSLQSQLNAENEALGRFYGQVGNYENAIKNVLGLNTEFGNSFLQLAQSSTTGEASLKSFFTNSTTSVKAFGGALTGLLANPAFLVIAGIVGVGVAFKFWYDYNKGIEEATRLTKQFTRLSGNDLKAYRNEVSGISETFNKDFKEVLEASNAISKQFGITNQEALKLVKDGFVAGADANGEYLSTLKEYPAYFKEAGISADQFIAIVAETGNQGVFSDKGIDAIKEANLRLREMNTSTADALKGIGISSVQVQKDLQSGAKTTFEVMQDISEKLNEYPEQSKQVGSAIADIFGGAGEDAGLQYLKTLKDIDTNIDSVKKKTGQLGEIQERQLNANVELQNVVSALFDQTGGTFESLIGNAKIFATESLTSIVKGLISIVNWFIEIYNKSMYVRSGVNAITFAFSSLLEVVKVLFGSALDLTKILANSFKALLTGEFSSIPDIVDKGMKETTNRFQKSWDNIKDIAKKSVEETLSGNIKPIDIPVNVVNGTDSSTKQSGKNKPVLTDEMKKAAEEERKAAIELAKFRLETEIKSNKDIADNQEKSYDERLNALGNYFNLQKAYIEKSKEFELTQKGLTASQIKLIKEKSNQQQIDLDKELADKSLQIMKDAESKRIEILNTDIQNRLSAVKQGSDQELALRIQQLDIQRQIEIDAAEKTGADKKAINDKYALLQNEEQQKYFDYWNQQAQKQYQNDIMQAQLNNQNTLGLQIAAKQAEIASLSQLQNESDVDYLNRKLVLQGQLKQLEDDLFQYQLESQTKYMQAVSTIAGGFEELFTSLAEDNEAFAVFAKAMALYQIGIDTATALTTGIAQAQKAGPFPANLVAIATTVATILSNIAKAKKYLSSEKQPKAPSFATGGYVSGEGSGTSDSISAYLSNGESVLTARATSMFSPVLSAFNQIGGGVPISTQDTANQVMGEEMLSRAFSKAVQSLPNPVVSVQEIDNVNNRISILETSRSI